MILVADSVGFGRLMGEDKVGAYAQFESHLGELIRPNIIEQPGRIAELTGERLLAGPSKMIEAMRYLGNAPASALAV